MSAIQIFDINIETNRQTIVLEVAREIITTTFEKLKELDFGRGTKDARIEKRTLSLEEILVEEVEASIRRERLIAQVNESRQAYETGQVRRGTAADFMAELDD